jgi:hypothetical protein
MTHPEKWYIPVTEDNHAELNRWRQSVATGHRSHQLRPKLDILLSKHIKDGSYYYASSLEGFKDDPDYNDYQEITLEQFRQITNSQPMKQPKHWCIEATEENFEELYAWWKKSVPGRYYYFRVGYTLMSDHLHDESKYYSGSVAECIFEYPQFVEITLEQFRQITNSQPMTHPEHWCIEATEENFSELYAWWRNNAAERYTRFHDFSVGYTLMSDHPRDESKYYSDSVTQCILGYPQFVEISLEQFRQITNSNQTQTTMSKSIQISRKLLNEYYDAATLEQKAYLTEHFKLDGSTTIKAIRGLHDMACEGWKPKIKKNHPDCFPEDSKYFDFSRHAKRSAEVVSNDVCESLGLDNDFIQVRNSSNPELHHRSFYLSDSYKWELKFDGEAMVLIPTKKSVNTGNIGTFKTTVV